MRFNSKDKNQQAMEEALSQCLDRLNAGASIEDCLAAHPKDANELRPMLQAAMAARVVAHVQPTNEALARGRGKLQAAMRLRLSPKQRERALEEALNRCLDRLNTGASIEECLAASPLEADELRPMLQAAMAARTVAHVQPPTEAMAHGRTKLRATMLARKRAGWSRLAGLVPTRAWSVGAAGVIVFGGGYGVVAASSNSLPNDTLYPVKRTVEQVELNWPLRSEQGKTRYLDSLAHRRTTEMARLSLESGAPLLDVSQTAREHIESANGLVLGKTDRDLTAFAVRRRADGPTFTPEEVKAFQDKMRRRLESRKAQLQLDYQNNVAILTDALANAPEDQRPQVRVSLEQLRGKYETGLHAFDEMLTRVRSVPSQPRPPRQGPPADGRHRDPSSRPSPPR